MKKKNILLIKLIVKRTPVRATKIPTVLDNNDILSQIYLMSIKLTRLVVSIKIQVHNVHT